MSTITMSNPDEPLTIPMPILNGPRPADLRSVFVDNIPLTATREQIHSAITRAVGTWGDLEDVRVPVRRKTGQTLGYAYAIFKKVIVLSGKLADAGPPSDEPLTIPMPIVNGPRPADLQSVFVDNIPLSATHEQIRSAITRAVGTWGDLVDVRVPTHLETGRTVGFAYAIFKKDIDVDESDEVDAY